MEFTMCICGRVIPKTPHYCECGRWHNVISKTKSKRVNINKTYKYNVIYKQYGKQYNIVIEAKNKSTAENKMYRFLGDIDIISLVEVE